ncbi:MAG: hypothetical protein OEM40_04115, partial [Acidimicrobiia bacterium]|nr:hypothetical protein [Acidimicrobiia bacterium]
GFYWFTIASPDSPTQERRDALEITGPLEGAMAGEGALADAVGRFMSNQSWYQGRPPRRSQTTVVDLVPLTPGEQDAAFWVALVAVGHDSGSQDLYVQTIGISFEPDAQLPASAIISAVHRDGTDGFVFDGLADPRGRTVLLDLVLAGDTLLGIAGSLSGNLAPTAADVTSDSPVDSTVHTNDRGETYIDYANGLTIKLFHRIEPGTNPDLELRRFLTERTAFEGVADTYGALEYLSGESHTVGILQQSFTQTPSAWSVFEQHCHSWLATVPDRMPPADPPPIWSRSDDAAGFSLPSVDLLQPALDLATELGSMTARLHLALGSFSEDPDLGTEPFTQHYQHSLYQSLRAGIRREFRAMRRLKTSAGPAIEEAIDDLLRAERECLDWLDAIRKKRIKGARIRLHGDYRLDEVFLVDGEFVIEDLSGDHSRPMSERRLRGSGLGDIAQMLRSFEYVGSSCALDRSRADQAWSVWWSQLVGNAFVTRYLTDLDGSLLLPDSSEAIDDLLRAFLMSRALRELHWELQNRQEWASIPLAELRRMLEQRPWFVDRD